MPLARLELSGGRGTDSRRDPSYLRGSCSREGSTGARARPGCCYFHEECVRPRGGRRAAVRNGHVRDPSEVTAAEVRDQLGRARRAASAAKALLDPTAARWLTSPDGAAVDYSRALVSAFDETRHARSPEAAADVLLNMASKLH